MSFFCIWQSVLEEGSDWLVLEGVPLLGQSLKGQGVRAVFLSLSRQPGALNSPVAYLRRSALRAGERSVSWLTLAGFEDCMVQ